MFVFALNISANKSMNYP